MRLSTLLFLHAQPVGSRGGTQTNNRQWISVHLCRGGQRPASGVGGNDSLGDYRTWTGEMDDFATKYHVIAYSLRNHYPNNQWTDGQPYSVQVHVADLVALLQTLNLGPVNLVGHSYGGVMAVLVAKEHPELIRTPDTWPKPSRCTGRQQRGGETRPCPIQCNRQSRPRLGKNGQSEQAAVTFFDFVNAPGGGFKGMPEFYQNGIRQNASTIKPMLASPPPPSFTCDDAKTIDANPADRGELTQKYRKMVNAELRRCMPNATVVTVAGAAHPLEMINPKGFNEAVLQFLAQR